MMTIQCILCQERGSQDGGGEAGKAKSQGLCVGLVSMWSCPLEWWDQLQEQLEEQNPGFGSTQGTEAAGKGAGVRSRALLELGERGSTPRVPPRVSVLTLEHCWRELTPTSHTQFQLCTHIQTIQLGNTTGKSPWEACWCNFSPWEWCGLQGGDAAFKSILPFSRSII